jgi:hypothetical protein
VPNDSKTATDGHPSGGHSFGMVQADIFRDMTLPAAVKLVYVALSTYASRERTAFPSLDRIAADTSLSVRTVKRAMKQAEAAGLVVVTRTQTVNRYQLRDLAVGGYVIGSGPQCPTVTLEVPHGHSGSDTVAHEQDQRTRPQSHTIDTSGDTSVGVDETTRRPRIHLPRGFAEFDDGQAFRYLVGAAVSALWAAGMTPADDAGDRLGRALKASVGEGMDRSRLVAALEVTLSHAGTDNPNWGSLAAWPAAA